MRIRWLDELRGVAVLMVLVGHFRPFLDPGLQMRFFDVMPRGVQLFYILSGYILYRVYQSTQLGRVGYVNFMKKRFFRIAPMFYLAVLVSFLLFQSDVVSPVSNLLSHFLILPMGFHPQFINGIVGVEWSIYVEWMFYLLFPLFLVGMNKSPRGFLLGAFVVSAGQSALLKLLTPDVGLRIFFYNQLTCQAVFFAAGMFLAKGLGIPFSPILGRRTVFFAIVLFLGMPFVVSSFAPQVYASLIFFCLLVWAWSGGVGDVLLPQSMRRFLNFSGDLSFSIYLVHFPVFRLVHERWRVEGLLGALVAFAGAIIISWFTKVFVEDVGIRVGKRLTQGRVPLAVQT